MLCVEISLVGKIYNISSAVSALCLPLGRSWLAIKNHLNIRDTIRPEPTCADRANLPAHHKRAETQKM